LGIQDGEAPGQVCKSIEQGPVNSPQEILQARGDTPSTRPPLATALHFFVRKTRYEAFALLPRHSFAERNRMQGQKPLWSPGAWQEYFSAAWLAARCPHVHISRACSGVARTPRPRTATTDFAFSDFMLFKVPRLLYTPWRSFGTGALPIVSHPNWQIAR